MIERTLLVVLLSVVGIVAYRLLVWRQVHQATAIATTDPLLHHLAVGKPTIVYFTTPTCAPCQLQQTPTLKRLQQEMGDALQVIRVDACEDPDAAERWGVFSVPTLFVLNRQGQPQKVYNGVVDGETLKRDLTA
jgi:thioredoxin-like negative regulator of GroEL